MKGSDSQERGYATKQLYGRTIEKLAVSIKTVSKGAMIEEAQVKVSARKIACHNNNNTTQRIETAGVVHTSLSGVKSYD